LNIQLRRVAQDNNEQMQQVYKLLKEAADDELWSFETFKKEARYANRILKAVFEFSETGSYDRILAVILVTLYGDNIIIVDRLVVTTDRQRRGIGTFCVDKLKASMPGLRRVIISTDVCETSLAAQLFLQQQGFTYFKTLDTINNGPKRYAFRFPGAAS
jgi:predicted GNAT superfamily acetyltransferase